MSCNGQPYVLPRGTVTNAATFSFTPQDAGSYQVSLTVQDSLGMTSNVASAEIAVADVAPSNLAISGLPAGMPITMTENQSALLTGSAMHPGNEPLTYTWSATRNGLAFEMPYTQVVAAGGQSTWTFEPTDDGTFVVTLTVSDGSSSATTSQTIQVAEQAPTGTPYVSISSIMQGDTFDFGLIDVTDASPSATAGGFTYSYDTTGDGVFDTVNVSTSTIPITLTTSGTHLLTVQVSDDEGLSTDYSVAVDVQNVSPVVTVATPNLTTTEGLGAELDGSFADPGSDQWTGTAEITQVGGASYSATVPLALNPDKTFSLNYVFPTAGTYNVTFQVSDNQPVISDLVQNNTTVVNVAGVQPTIDPLDDVSLIAGQPAPYVVPVSFSAPGDDAWSYAVDLGDGAGFGSFQAVAGGTQSFTIQLQYATPGGRTVQVELSDQPGGANPVVASFVADVAADQPPTVAEAIPSITTKIGYSGDPDYADLTQVFSDPEDSSLTYSIVANTNAGLVTPSIDANGNLGLAVAAAQTGTAQITVQASDPENETVDNTFTVQIVPDQPPTVAAAIPNLQAQLGTAVQTDYADLTQVFTDPDDLVSTLQFSIASNSNAALVQPSIGADDMLSLAFTAGQTGTATIAVQATDPLGASVSDSFTVSVVSPFIINGTPGNDTIRVVRDSLDPTLTDEYLNGAIIASVVTASGTQFQVLGGWGSNQLTVDFSQGNPLPVDGLTFDGGTGDTLVIQGTSGDDSVTVTRTQVTVDGYPAISYGATQDMAFPLGTGFDSLTIDQATVRLNSSSAISAGTAVTITGGGVLDLGGFTQTVAAATVLDGSVINGTLLTGSDVVLVESGSSSANISGPAVLIKSTAGTAILSGTSSFTGGTIVTAGALILSSTQAIPEGSSLRVGAADLTFYPLTLPQSAAVSTAALASAGAATASDAASQGVAASLPARRKPLGHCHLSQQRRPAILRCKQGPAAIHRRARAWPTSR